MPSDYTMFRSTVSYSLSMFMSQCLRNAPVFLCAMAFMFVIAGNVNAALWDRGGGLIYDDVLNITWLQDANYAKTSGYDADGGMVWAEAINWETNLTYYENVRGVTYDDWRLPHALPVNGNSYTYNFAYDGSSDRGYNVSAPGTVYQGSTASEMAYTYFNTLGNKAYYDVNESGPQSGWGLQNTGLLLTGSFTPTGRVMNVRAI